MEIIRFQTNVPEELALKYATGKDVEGRYGPQVMFTLTDDRVMYVVPVVAERIEELGLRPGERFSICKREVKQGRKAGVEWTVQRVDPPGSVVTAPAASSAPVPIRAAQQETASNPTADWISHNSMLLTGMLCASIDAYANAQRYAASLGLQYQFNEEDIRAAALTLFIQSSRSTMVRAA